MHNKPVFEEIESEMSPDFKRESNVKISIKKRPNSDKGTTSGKKTKSDIDMELISQKAESVLRERVRNKSIALHSRRTSLMTNH